VIENQIQIRCCNLIADKSEGFSVFETGSEMSALLDLSNPVELHSYIDLPERLGCPASARNRQNPLPEIDMK
jgi:hypothetical protein